MARVFYLLCCSLNVLCWVYTYIRTARFVFLTKGRWGAYAPLTPDVRKIEGEAAQMFKEFFNELSTAILFANLIGFPISFLMALIHNLMQNKKDREWHLGSILGWGVFFSFIAFLVLGLKSCGT